MVQISSKGTPKTPAFRAYYEQWNVDGKSSQQVLEVDLVNQIIYEDKSAGKLYIENADFPQTEQQWAFKQIYKKASNRIDTDTPALHQAVEECLDKLRAKYPEYNFSATYGGK